LRREESRQDWRLPSGEPALLPDAPSRPQLEALIEAAFWASVRRDEGRPVSFALAYVEPEEGNTSFIFKQPVPFATEGLARLGPAIQNSDARIGVWPGDGGELKLWGYTTLDYPCFEITVLAPGQLVVGFVTSNLAALFDRRAVFVDDRCLRPQAALWSQVFPPDDPRLRGRGRRVEAVLGIARAMRWHSGGGTLLVVPPGEGWRGSIQEPLLYEPEPYFARAFEALERVLQASAPDERGFQAGAHAGSWRVLLSDRFQQPERELRHSLRSIGRLTAVDGATVLTSDLCVKGFGAKIRAVNADHHPTHVLVREPIEGIAEREVPISELGNMRHQSAAQFVFDQQDSLAVVASQDRTVTLLAWDRDYGGVLAIRHAEFALL
jgi:hypothetical protein